MVLALVARRSILIAIVDIIHIHAEAGAGGQHEHVAFVLSLRDVVGDGDEILPAIDAAEEGAFAVVLHLLGRWLSEGEEGGGGLFLQSAHLIIAEVLPYAVLDAHECSRLHIHAGGHTHSLVHGRHGVAFQLGLRIALARFGGTVIVVGDVVVVGILIVFPSIWSFVAIGIHAGADFHSAYLVAALLYVKSDAAALVVEHEGDALCRARGIYPLGDAVVGVVITLGGIIEHVVVIAQAPCLKAQRASVLPGQGVLGRLYELCIGAVAVQIVVAHTPCFGHPVDAQTDIAVDVFVDEVVGAIGTLALPPRTVCLPIITIDAHSVVFVERSIVYAGIARVGRGEFIGNGHVEVDGAAQQGLLSQGHIHLFLLTSHQEGRQQDEQQRM